MSTKELGNKGEDIACEYLVNNGYEILCRNYRIKFGEIDIIAREKQKLFGKSNKDIHFVEVKALSCDGVFLPEDHFNYKKQQKYRRLVEIWLNENKFTQDYPCQVDLIAVSNGNVEFFGNVISG